MDRTTIDRKLRELGLELPPAPAPAGNYVPAVRAGQLVFTAGQLPFRGADLMATGKVPHEVPIEQAKACAAQAALNALAAFSSACPLDRLARVVRVNVFVNSSPGFTEQAKVANGASDLLAAVLGDAGRHTRCAIGAAELPLNSPVEVDMVMQTV
jgi:enamine deaminase RidA (YjgF/YER057c/UK114 family)